MVLVYGAAGVLVGVASVTSAQSGQAAADVPITAKVAVGPLALTLEQIMADPDWIARSPERAYWSDDSGFVYYSRKRFGEDRRDLYKVNVQTGQTTLVTPADLPGEDVRGGAYTRDRRAKVYARGGDLYLKDLMDGRVQQLTRTGDVEHSPRFLVGDFRIAYQRGSQTYVRDLASGMEYQVADIRAEKKPEEPEAKKDKDDYLRQQQERLFDTIKEKRAEREAAREQEKIERAADTARVARPWYLGDEREVREQSLSPTGEMVLVRLAKKGRKEGKADVMPSYVTEDGYVSTRSVRSKVGTTTRTADEVVLLDLAGRAWSEPERAVSEKNEKGDGGGEKEETAVSGTAVGVDGVYSFDLSVLPGIAEDPLKGLREKAKGAAEAGAEGKSGSGDEPGVVPAAAPGGEAAAKSEPASEEKKVEAPKPRPVSITGLEWNEQGSRALVQVSSHDNKDRWIAVIDAASKELTPLEHFRDEAWINGGFSRGGWLRDGRTMWVLSEETGYAQVYFRDVVDGTRWALRPGGQDDQPFEVVDVDVNLAGDAMYFVASLPGRPGVREAYRALIGPGQFEERKRFAEQGSEVGFPVQQLTEFGGQNEFWASPDDRLGLVLHSTIGKPAELYVVPLLTPGAITASQATRLTETITPEFAGLAWTKPEVVAIPGREGRVIWARVWDARVGDREEGKRPAVVFIHGAGYLQDAHEGWSYYFREHLYHALLAERGYVVISMDYRASAGYGRDWRTAIYRQMGYPELDDLEDGVAWMVKERGVDAKRVGCYGGSYGGFLTLMAMFTRPELFVCGAALRPVTDWAHYNEGYTANILNVPSVDPESFEKSSPIEHAAGLRGHLLICHGMLDDNVLFQDTVRLSQRLIELKKENWEVAMYPVEGHGFTEPTSWLDEFRRIDRLFRSRLEEVGGANP